MTITASTLANNSAGSAGALFANFGQAAVTVSDSTFSGNQATNTVTGLGGAIWVGAQAQVYIAGGAITNNPARFGGGLYLSPSATVTFTSSGAPAVVSGNSATRAGGGLYNSLGSVTLANVTLSGNSAHTADSHVATFGGGVDNYQGTVAVSDATIVSNTADLDA